MKHEVATDGDLIEDISSIKQTSRFRGKVFVVPQITTHLVDKVAFDHIPFKQHDGSR